MPRLSLHFPSRELMIVDLQSKIKNHQSTMICGAAELSVNLGLTRGHGSLLLDLEYFRAGNQVRRQFAVHDGRAAASKGWAIPHKSLVGTQISLDIRQFRRQ
jgi:hypothetical protein